MFQPTTYQLGHHQLLSFSDDNAKNKFTVCLNQGGTWVNLSLNGHDLLDSYQNEAELNTLNAAKNVVLLPFVNRLKDGCLHWQGKRYEWPINDHTHQHAIHGFGMHLPMSYAIHSLSPLVFELSHTYLGQHCYYPFAFDFKIIYQLRHQGELSVTMQVSNTDSVSFPFAMGCHPYFQIAATIDACFLDIQPLKKICVDTRMIPTGACLPMPEAKRWSLSNLQLDDCFRVISDSAISRLRLYDENKSLLFWQTTGDYGLNYLQLYTPPDRQSIAIEPMTSGIDGVNGGLDGWVLNPGDTRAVQWGVALQENGVTI